MSGTVLEVGRSASELFNVKLKWPWTKVRGSTIEFVQAKPADLANPEMAEDPYVRVAERIVLGVQGQEADTLFGCDDYGLLCLSRFRGQEFVTQVATEIAPILGSAGRRLVVADDVVRRLGKATRGVIGDNEVETPAMNRINLLTIQASQAAVRFYWDERRQERLK